MTIRLYKFLIATIGVLGAVCGYGQQAAEAGTKTCETPARTLLYSRTDGAQPASSLSRSSTLPYLLSSFRTANALRPVTISQDQYTKNLAFFCRQELKLEKAAKIPLRLRMGSLEESNRLEGK